MKKRLAFLAAFAVLICSSCGQQVVEHGNLGGGTTSVTVSASSTEDELYVEGDAADITEEAEASEAQTDTPDTVTEIETEAVEEVITETETAETEAETSADTEEAYEDEEYEDQWEDESEDEEEEPEYDYDPAEVAEKAKALGKTAKAIGNEVEAFLLKSVLSGYGMTLGGEGTFMSIYIEDGLWMISIDDTDYFNYTEEMEWFGYGEADSTTDKADAEEPDTLLAIALVKKFPEIQNGSAGLWLQSGTCKAAYFTEDTTAGDGQMDFLMGEGGWQESWCEWDTYNFGMSDEGNIVGTSPELKFKVEE